MKVKSYYLRTQKAAYNMVDYCQSQGILTSCYMDDKSSLISVWGVDNVFAMIERNFDKFLRDK